MNKTVRNIALATGVAAGSLALLGCGDGNSVKGVGGTGESFNIMARITEGRCVVGLYRDYDAGPFPGAPSDVKVQNGSIISNPTEVKALLTGNPAALKAAIEKGCGKQANATIIVEQSLADLQRQ